MNNSYLAKREQGGLLVDSWTPEQKVVGSKSTSAMLSETNLLPVTLYPVSGGSIPT